MKKEKNFTYTITYRDIKKGIVSINKQVNRARGYGQSWFATEEAARKAVKSLVEPMRNYWFVSEIIEWTIEDRNGIIEKGC